MLYGRKARGFLVRWCAGRFACCYSTRPSRLLPNKKTSSFSTVKHCRAGSTHISTSDNHLDHESVKWLETFLRVYDGAVIVVSHDRAFMDHLVARVAEIDARLAIVMGTEGDGLGKRTIAASDYTVKIPMDHGVDSLTAAKGLSASRRCRRAAVI